jgi:hypothetical protein
MNDTPALQIPIFSSNHLVQIIDTYLDGNEIIFIYEAMDVSLRQITGVSSLRAFHIAAVCKQVSPLFC